MPYIVTEVSAPAAPLNPASNAATNKVFFIVQDSFQAWRHA
jgi:hypothetical protein